MGLAASQARLLTITARLADNELRSQTINNAKMRLATQSAQASQNYVNALNQSDLMFKNTMLDGTSQTQLLTYNALNAYSPYNTQYGLVNNSGLLLVSEAEADMFQAAGGDLQKYLKAHGIAWESTYFTLQEDTQMMSELQAAYSADCENLFAGVTKSDLEKYYEQYNSSAEYLDYEKYRTGTLSEYKTARENFRNWILNDSENGGTRLVSDVADAAVKSLTTLASTILGSKDNGQNKILNTGTYALGGSNQTQGLYYQVLAQIAKNTGLSVDKLYNDYYSYKNDEDETKYDGTPYTSYTYEGPITVNSTNDYYSYNKEILSSEDYTVDETNYTITVDGYVFSFSGAGNSRQLTGIITNDGEEIAEPKGNVIYVKNGDEYNKKYEFVNGELVETSLLLATVTNRENFLKEIATDMIYNMIKSAASEGAFKAYLANNVDKNLSQDNITNLLKFMFGTNSDGAAQNPLSDTNLAVNDYANMDMVLDGLYIKYKNEYNNNGNFVDWLVENEKITQEYSNLIRMHQVDVMVYVYGEPKYAWTDSTDKSNTGNPDSRAQWFTNLFNRMNRGYQVLEDGLASSNDWIEYAFKNGLVSMEQVDSNFNWVALNYQTCVGITEQTDNSAAVAKAEAEYNRAMNDIKQKDSIYDLQLKNIDTEHNSLQQEYDSISKVISKNIERTMKFDQNG